METIDEIMLLEMKRIYISIERIINELAEQSGLTAAQCSILVYILKHSNNEIYATDIHKELGLSRAAISGIVKKLRMKGYLTFQDCKGDDRQKRILATNKAKKVQSLLDNYMQKVGNCVYCNFSNNEKIILEEMQRKIIQNLTEYYNKNKKKREVNKNEDDFCTVKTV